MNERKRERGFQIIVLLLIVNLVVSGGMIYFLAVERQKQPQEIQDEDTKLWKNKETGIKYTLYIGTNDKDTYTQKIATKDAREIVNEICAKYVEGYTASDAKGGWVDETDTLTQENTLVYTFYDVKEEQLTKVMDEVLEKLNQNSILIECQNAVYTYYSGK